MPADQNWNDAKGVFETPEYSPSPYAHAQRHLDAAEEWTDKVEKYNPSMETALVHAFIGIGLALLAIARKR